MNSKWIKFICNIDSLAFSEVLLKFPISKDSSYGFDVHSFDESQSKCSYFEKYDEVVKYSLPNGELFTYETVKVIKFDFSIFFLNGKSIVLCVNNPPKSLRSFISKISESLGPQVYVSNVFFDVISFYNAFKASPNLTEFNVNEITVSNILFDENNSGELTLKSRTNALLALEQRFSHNRYTCKGMRFSFFNNGVKGKIKISRMGTIDFSENLYDLLPTLLLDLISKNE
jgi:hypothetical protein